MPQTAITFVALVRDGWTDELRNLLRTNPIAFQLLPSLHFTSMFLTNAIAPTYFIWENNFDGTTRAYVELVSKAIGEKLQDLYVHCADYAVGDDLVKYLRAHIREPRAYHIGAPGLTVRRVKAERHLVLELQGYLDAMKLGSVRDAATAKEYLQLRVEDNHDLRWAETPEKRLGMSDLIKRRWNLVWVGILFIIVLLALTATALLPMLVALLRWNERRGVPDSTRENPRLADLLKHEDHGVQNHLAVVTSIKPGRGWLLGVILWGASFVARVQTNGKLGGIPGIFFAHWSVIDEGRKLLFVSNYGGALDSYLDDFIDIASWGLTPIWSNTQGFPETRLLFWGGSRDRKAFKSFVRNHQVESLVWYSAYQGMTVDNVNRNSAIRDGLFRRMDAIHQSEWLKLF